MIRTMNNFLLNTADVTLREIFTVRLEKFRFQKKKFSSNFNRLTSSIKILTYAFEISILGKYRSFQYFGCTGRGREQRNISSFQFADVNQIPQLKSRVPSHGFKLTFKRNLRFILSL